MNFVAKVAIGRQRPLIEDHPPLAKAPTKLSFPSAHATSSAAAATALGRVQPRARPYLFALAAAICVGRPYLGMHYPSDVIAGVALGTLLGSVVPGLGEPHTEDRLFELAGRRELRPTRRAAGPRATAACRAPAGVKIGIVGLPNAGKSTLFNALTRAGAETGDYAFTTIDPNVAVVGVPDARLERVAAVVGASEVVPETIEFHDIAGLVPGAAQGEGLGNKFLGAIRETDAICHVVRCHASGAVPHPEGRVDPGEDIDLIETELLAADLEQAERRLERVVKQARSGAKEAIAEQAWLEQVVEGLGAGRWVREMPAPEAAGGALRRLSALTSKPVLYVANVEEGVEEVPPPWPPTPRGRGQRRGDLGADRGRALGARRRGEASECGRSSGSPSPPRPPDRRRVRAAQPRGRSSPPTPTARRWRGRSRGATAWEAAGKVHTDIQRAFVRAEVVAWDALVDAGGYAAARERGVLRTEGRDYVVADGDVITIKV